MILAAGLGTRLKPFTSHHPKALATVNNLPLLHIALQKIKRLGIKKVIVNVHHFADQVTSFIQDYDAGNMEILISDERAQLLDTGGGVLKAGPLFDKGADILIYNVDVVTNAPLEELIATHQKQQNIATLWVQPRSTSRFLLFTADNQLCGWRNTKTGDELWVKEPIASSPLGFNGIQVIQHRLLSLLPPKGAFPIIPEYLNLAGKYKISGWRSDDSQWFDTGTPEKLKKATDFITGCPSTERSYFL
jgi:NDP-sugar pyrophosphorylase family protein